MVKFLKVWRLGIHWQVAVAMVIGTAIGLVIQQTEAESELGGVTFEAAPDGTQAIVVKTVEKNAIKDKLLRGDISTGDRLRTANDRAVTTTQALEDLIGDLQPGQVVVFELSREDEKITCFAKVVMSSDSARSQAVFPFDFIAKLFLRLLQMLIVPLIVTSMITGVLSLGDAKSLGRMGIKAFFFYLITSLLAILVGLVLVNLIRPGDGADIPLSESVSAADLNVDENPLGILLRMVPVNPVEAMSSNSLILQVIFFSLLMGVFILRAGDETRGTLSRGFQAGFEVMMAIATFVLRLVPIGVVALLARVVGLSGLAVFEDLAKLMLTVVLALAFHAFVTLPLILFLVGRVHPLRWAKAVWPALVMAFSTSSSSITLPVTMRAVEKRGGATNRVSSFVLPLGATINMDGTALYECVGVMFLAQYYASVSDFELTIGMQVIVVFTALLASVGAAGIPSAGLVMMTTILSALGLPLEGTFLLLAIDRPLDMLRTATNIWSDTTCVAVIARSEGETGIKGGMESAASRETAGSAADDGQGP